MAVSATLANSSFKRMARITMPSRMAARTTMTTTAQVASPEDSPSVLTLMVQFDSTSRYDAEHIYFPASASSKRSNFSSEYPLDALSSLL
ncbi:hypothetical protein NP493_781g02012 [Ridgeia piscesae]|uniref:Uncharacterized protein n=1 Tax=Ridgeia piscesae TaxID=27915 RepID=A0AAD9NLH7_RIDPI|nr:hypothetical protein NP493_781g02012 [Ridgeia piscesae]